MNFSNVLFYCTKACLPQLYYCPLRAKTLKINLSLVFVDMSSSYNTDNITSLTITYFTYGLPYTFGLKLFVYQYTIIL